MIEIISKKEFKELITSCKKISGFAFQGIDLLEFSEELNKLNISNSIFLGCNINSDLLKDLYDKGNIVIPSISGLPYKTSPCKLYTPTILFNNFDPENPSSYKDTYDYKTYEHFLETGRETPSTIKESLSRRLHDHSVTDALNDILKDFDNETKIVAVMGGHSLSRADSNYLKIAEITQKLALKGYLIISGGGPGAMEAAHLGVWFAARTSQELENAVSILSSAPMYNDKQWLSNAYRVRKKYPQGSDRFMSIGIPTWLYGHEPPNPFATQIAKYFSNCVREEGLLAIAKGGVIYAPGSAGTIQEIFQDACQNHYCSYGITSPMIFMNKHYWTEKKPVYPLLKKLAEGKEYAKHLGIFDDRDEIVNAVLDFNRTAT